MTQRRTIVNGHGAIGCLLSAAALAVLACMDGDAPAHGGPTVWDSAGVSIVEYGSEFPVRAEWALKLDEALRLSEDFFQVRAAIRLEDGRIVVADGGSRTLRFFEQDGTSAGSIGREGEGPGEFRDLSFMGRWPGDSILVWDWQLRRLSLFDDEGRLARIFEPEVTAEVPFANVRGIHGDGSMLATGFAQTPEGGPQSGRQRYRSPAYHFRSDGSLTGVLPVTASSEAYYERFGGGGFTAFWTCPGFVDSEWFGSAASTSECRSLLMNP